MIIVVVFEADAAELAGWSGEGDDAGEVASSAEEVELDASKDCEEGEGV